MDNIAGTYIEVMGDSRQRNVNNISVEGNDERSEGDADEYPALP